MSRLTDSALKDLIGFAHELADLSAAVILEHFRADLAVADKGDGRRYDPVTAADRESEKAMRTAIERRFPEHGIRGEEFPDRPAQSPFQWVIDPIDGTQAFISGLPTWGTVLALCEGAAPVLGLMNQAFVGERFIGSRLGSEMIRGTTCRALRTRGCRGLEQASLFATSPFMFERPAERAAFDRVSRRVRHTRFGADCYAYCLLAAGHIDVVIESSMAFHDVAGLIPIVENAGGLISDWRGRPIADGRQTIAAATPQLHAQALELLAGAAD